MANRSSPTLNDTPSTVPADQRVAHEVELCRLAVALAEQLCFRVCLAFVRVILALFAMKIAFAVAAGRGRFVAAVTSAKALQAGPCFDQRAIDREVIVGEEALDLGMPQHGFGNLAATS